MVEKSRASTPRWARRRPRCRRCSSPGASRLWQHLEREHLPKEGLRYWFANERRAAPREASETGGFVRSAVPSFQLRRDALDQHLLDRGGRRRRRAPAAGAGARGRARQLRPPGDDRREGARDLRRSRCRWLIDATGRATLPRPAARSDREERASTRPPRSGAAGRTCSHIDDLAARGPVELRARATSRSRRLATNHYVGPRLLGLVHPARQRRDLDRHRLRPPAPRPARAAAIASRRYRRLPAPSSSRRSELLDGRRAARARTSASTRICPTSTKQYMGEGWALVGDAAAFLDPYYSPGLDHCRFSVEATVEHRRRPSRGESSPARIAEHNADLPALLPALLRGDLPRQVLLHGRARSALGRLPARHRAVLHLRGHPAYRSQPLPLDAGAGAEARLLQLPPDALLQPALQGDRRARARAMGEAGRRNHGRRSRPTSPWTSRPAMALRGLRLWSTPSSTACGWVSRSSFAVSPQHRYRRCPLPPPKIADFLSSCSGSCPVRFPMGPRAEEARSGRSCQTPSPRPGHPSSVHRRERLLASLERRRDPATVRLIRDSPWP